ncbi:hypothetical protein OHB07_38110 [Streptomyces sp. NBC_00111]|uniref:hypothetical protein n=1 Tax=unclassified Streptomyces TaxID=2593676 RepID=UPI002E33D2FD|nr:hypothetical protein [Streptomyces sp. NBC_01460]
MSAERAQAVQVTLAELRRAGGHQRGLAGRLARTHGVNERTWARAVTDARAMYAAETTQDKCEAPPPGAGPAVQARLQAPFRGGLPSERKLTRGQPET